jgi:hypothetical protein
MSDQIPAPSGFIPSSPLAQAVIITSLAIITFAVIYFVYFKVGEADYVNIFTGILNGNETMTINQDPNLDGSKTLLQSRDRPGGIEFAYVFWINPTAFPDNGLRRVFVKGTIVDGQLPTQNGKNMMAPGVFLLPNSTMRIYMNTLNNPIEYVDVQNLLTKWWTHVVIQVQRNQIEVYLNGNVVVSKPLTGVPRLNFYNLNIGHANHGFAGKIADLTYYRRALTLTEIRSLGNKPRSNYFVTTSKEDNSQINERSPDLHTGI